MLTQNELQNISLVLKNGVIAQLLDLNTYQKAIRILMPNDFVSVTEIRKRLHCSKNYPKWLFDTGKLKKVVVSERKIGTTMSELENFIKNNKEKIERRKEKERQRNDGKAL